MSMDATTLTQAADSVLALFKLARQHCGGSTPAALVLLSAQDSYRFSLPVAELRRLDGSYYRHAMNVIDCSYRGIQPARLLQDGQRHFDALADEWQHLGNNPQESAA